MATDFIIMRTDLCRDQRVLRMARRLKIDEFSVAGRLLEVWTWADETAVCVDPRGAAEPEDVTEKAGQKSRSSRDGLVTGVPLSYIDRVAHMPGFGDAMAAEGWVIEEEDERHDVRLRFPRFDKWNWGGARERAKNAIRKKRSREKRDECHGKSVTDVTENAGQMSRENRDACTANGVTTEQNRTVLKDRTVLPACASGESKSSAPSGRGGDARGDGSAGRQAGKADESAALGGWGTGWGDAGEPRSVREALTRLGMRNPALMALSAFAEQRPEALSVETVAQEAAMIRVVAIEDGIRSPVGLLAHRLAERMGIEFGIKTTSNGAGGLTAKQSARLAQLRLIAEGQRSAGIERNGVKGSGIGHQASGSMRRMGGAA